MALWCRQDAGVHADDGGARGALGGGARRHVQALARAAQGRHPARQRARAGGQLPGRGDAPQHALQRHAADPAAEPQPQPEGKQYCSRACGERGGRSSREGRADVRTGVRFIAELVLNKLDRYVYAESVIRISFIFIVNKKYT